MGFFTSSKSWGAQMKAASDTKTAKQARAEAHKKNNPSEFKQRKAAAKNRNGKK